MSDDIAVKIQDVSKSFKLPHEKSGSVKSALLGWRKRKRGYENQHVLKNISFEIKKGEFFGIVGRNGSGKSTLLKLISQIYTPDKGTISVNGKLTPFIELGVGFNPELSGRDNVYLNGALLGFGREEMDAMYDEIVEFAELGRFMDQKLKNYSSGMQVRLAFSIAIRANTDILVLDEVLAVGDEAFQRKCNSYFNSVKKQKKTVILVTHSMAAVEEYCTRAMLLDSGEIRHIGSPHKVASEYSKLNDLNYVESSDRLNVENEDYGDVAISIMDKNGEPKRIFHHGDPAMIRLTWKSSAVKYAGVAIFRENGEYVFGPSSYHDSYELKKGKELTYGVTLNLGEGEYYLKVGLTGEGDKKRIAFVDDGPHFIVKRKSEEVTWGGVTKLDYYWE